MSQSGIVGIAPASMGGVLVPWQSSEGLRAVVELVESAKVGEVWIVAQDEQHVFNGWLDTASWSHLELLDPLITDGFLFINLNAFEVHVGGADAFFVDGIHHVRVVGRQLVHLSEGRLFVDRPFRRIGVKVTKQMQPDKVERVTQHAGGGIRCVVGVGEFILINDKSCRRGAVDIGVTVFFIGRQVDVGKVFIDGLMNVVRPAEGTDHPAFSGWVFLLFAGRLMDLCGPRGHRPVADILPVGVLIQHFIGIEEVAFLSIEEVFSVTAGGRPVHQTCRLVGGIVELIDAQLFCQLACDGLVLLGADVS